VRTLIATCSAVAALILAPSAMASPPASAANNAPTSLAVAVVPVVSGTARPPGFSADAFQAVAAAKATPQMQALHRREHPLHIDPGLWVYAPRHWYIQFSYHGQVVAEVDVGPTGHVLGVWTGPAATASYAHGHYAPVFDSWWVIVPFSLVFLLPFLDLRRLWRLAHLDALVLLSFWASYALFDHSHLETGVWLAYPPMIYLMLRMLMVGLRAGRQGETLVAPLLSTRVLAIGLIALVAGRVVLSLVSHQLIDVGAASLVGAHRIALGHSPYYASAAHSDTYGPIAYLAYVPFERLFPFSARVGYLPAAEAASIFFDLVTVVGLVLLGRRIRKGRDGLRLGLVFAWVWSACPFTLLALMMHVNDGLVAMLSVLSLLALSSPVGRGALLGLAAAAKFSPAALLPLYAGRDRRGLKGSILCVVSFAAVAAIAIALYLPSGGLTEFYNHTIGYQLSRSDVFSPWALHPALNPIKDVLEVAALGLAALLAFIPKQRSAAQVAALAGAVTLAVQLPAVHWFYYYIVWFVPFVIVGLLGRQPATAEATVTVPQDASPSATYVPGQPVRVGA
jgi:hypothetical protein